MANPTGQVAADAVLDSALDLFEREWKAGKQPRVAEYVGLVGTEMRLRLLEELIYLESEYRGTAEQPAALQTYLAEFPELAGDADRVGRLEQELRRIGHRSGSARVASASASGQAAEHDPQGRSTVPAPEAARNVHAANGNAESISAPPRIGRYIVLQIISSGGQADVFRVAHPKLGGEFILKRFRPKAGIDAVDMLEEGRKLQSLSDCPAIAKVFDADIVDGLAIIVVEYIKGQTLAQYSRVHTLGPIRSAQMVAAIGRGLGAAHRIGITHLDVKPDNILVDSAGRPRLIDFGIARVRGAWHDEINAEGSISGTPAYMSPEQAQGRSQELGPRSDVFSLGGVLFTLLTGRPLYDADSRSAYLAKAAQWQWDKAALRSAPAPRKLKEICRKAIAKAPADRYADGDAFAGALKSYLRFITIRRWMALAACLLAVIGGGVLAWQRLFPNDPLVDLPLQVMVGREDKVTAMSNHDLIYEGEWMQISAPSIPPGRYAYVYLYDGLTMKPLGSIAPGDPSRDLDPKSFKLSAIGAPVTEVILVLSSRHRLDDLAPTWPRGLPALPIGAAMKATPTEISLLKEPRDMDPFQAIDKVQDQLKTLRQSLLGRVDGFEAIVFRLDPEEEK